MNMDVYISGNVVVDLNRSKPRCRCTCRCKKDVDVDAYVDVDVHIDVEVNVDVDVHIDKERWPAGRPVDQSAGRPSTGRRSTGRPVGRSTGAGRPVGRSAGRPVRPLTLTRPPDRRFYCCCASRKRPIRDHQIADSSAVGHPEGAQAEAARSQILVLLRIQKAPKERPPNRRFYFCWAPRKGGIQRAPAELGRQRKNREADPPVRNTVNEYYRIAS